MLNAMQNFIIQQYHRLFWRVLTLLIVASGFFGTTLLLNSTPAPTTAQSGIVYNALPAFYQERLVFYYIFENGTPVLDEGRAVAVVDQYRLVNVEGEPIEGQYDIIPTGGPFAETYSDLREVVEVTVPADYEPNSLTSVEDLDDAGLLAEDNVNRTGETINAPAVFQGATLQGREQVTGLVWEGGREQAVFNFGSTPAQTAPIYLLVTDEAGSRLDGVSSVIEQMHADEGYSDFWQVFEVRVPPDTDPNSIRSYEDIVELGLPVRPTPAVVNCPAIRLENMAKAYWEDTLYHITQVERPDLPLEDTLPPLYLVDEQPELVLAQGPGDANYTRVCQPQMVQLNQSIGNNKLTNALSIEENTNIEVTSSSQVSTCAILAEVLPGEAE